MAGDSEPGAGAAPVEAAAPSQVQDVVLTEVPVAAASTASTAAAPEAAKTAEPAAPAAAAEAKADDAKSKREYDAVEHLMSLEELAAHHGVTIDFEHPGKSPGLSDAEAAARLLKYGKNMLSPPKTMPGWLKFLRGFTHDLFMVLLQFAGWFCILASGLSNWDETNLILGITLFIVVFVTNIITFMQARAAGDVMATFSKMLPAQCTVFRGGKELRIPASDLVLGDMVRLGLGDRVPADIRLIDVKDLKVECSSLTGEPDAIPCTVESHSEMPLESHNLVFNSSLVMNGEGRGIVMRTGDHTMIGSIAKLATGTGSAETTMQREIKGFVRFVAIISTITALIFFAIGMIRMPGDGLNNFINGFIVVMVANVPEGLPATVTTCLTISAKRMGQRHVFIKRTDVIETLGSASVVCSDKTGTLTQNKMTVEHMWYGRSVVTARAGVSRQTAIAMASGGVGTMGTLGSTNADIAYAMTIGRQAAPAGDGTLKISKAPSSRGLAGVGFLPQPAAAVDGAAQMTMYGSFSSFRGFSARTVNRAGGSMPRASWNRANPYMRMSIMAGVCNRARYVAEGEEAAGAPKKAAVPTMASERQTMGDASDTALLHYVDGIVPIEEMRMTFPVLHEQPFNSTNKWACSIIRDPDDSTNKHILFLKGAPEIVLQRCSHYMTSNGKELPIDDEFREEFQAAYEQFGFMGERVLGFTYKTFPANREPGAYAADDGTGTAYPKTGLVFGGLISLVDPPREGVDVAVATLRRGGIRVTMVTGDNPLTAEAIARKVGIITLPTIREVAAEDGVDEDQIPLSDPRVRAVVRAGHQIRGLNQEQWDTILTKDEVVFARTTPQQKLEIAENYQRLGHVLAMTGDGVNDSPALKAAHIGIAFGSSRASDVARDAAGIILMDDNFASIVNAVEEGRVLYDHLKCSIAYTLAHLWPELLPVFLNLAFSFPLALPGLIILTIDLISEQGPAISFAYEKAEAAVMQRPPRNLKTDRLVSRPLLIYTYAIAGGASMLVCMFAYFMVYVKAGVPISALAFTSDKYWKEKAPDFVVDGKVFTEAQQLTLYRESVAAWYMCLIMNQFAHMWFSKTRRVSVFVHGVSSNIVAFMGGAIAVFVLLLVVYTPWLQPIFQTASLSGEIWPVTLVYTLFIGCWTEGTKWMARNKPESWWARHFSW